MEWPDNFVDRVVCGDCREALKGIPDGVIQLVCCSPPYYSLRNYDLEPTLWGGDPLCEHVWGEEHVVAGSYGLNKDFNKRWHGYEGESKKQEDMKPKEVNQGQFCQRCGCWRGALGLEPDPDMFVGHLVDIFREVKRVLRDDGLVFIVIADSYASQGGPQAKQTKWQVEGASDTQNQGLSRMPPASLKAKDLVGIPFRLFLALQADGWVMRSVIIYSKKNPMPESTTDRCTTSHEYVFMMAKSNKPTFWSHRDHAGSRTRPKADYRWWDYKEQVELDSPPLNWKTEKFYPSNLSKYADTAEEVVFKMGKPVKAQRRYRRYNLWRGHDYYYDQVAIMEPYTEPMNRWGGEELVARGQSDWDKATGQESYRDRDMRPNKHGRNRRSVWSLATQSFAGSHFAVMPQTLVEPMVLAGSPERCCPKCGAGWKRVVEKEAVAARDDTGRTHSLPQQRMGKTPPPEKGWDSISHTIGWLPTCQCDGNDGSGKAIILDCFAGVSTTAVVAKKLGRSWFMIDQNLSYVEMGEKRIEETQGPRAEDEAVQLELF